MTLHPTDPAVRTLLSRSMIVELATVSRARRPFVTPIWFVFDAGMVWMTTGLETRAARNIAQEPRVALLVTGERGSAGVLRIAGTATRHAGLPPWRVLLRIAAKYYVAPGALASELANAAKWRLRARYYAEVKGGAGHLRIVPTAAELLQSP